MLKTNLSRLEIKERRAKDAYMDGIDTLEEYKQNKSIIQDERIVFDRDWMHIDVYYYLTESPQIPHLS